MAKGNGLPAVDNYAALKKVQPADGPRLPASAQAVLAEQDHIAALVQTRAADPLVTKAMQDRNNQAFGAELIKAVRSNPSNRLSGARYQVR
jgi:hypothetical protein